MIDGEERVKVQTQKTGNLPIYARCKGRINTGAGRKPSAGQPPPQKLHAVAPGCTRLPSATEKPVFGAQSADGDRRSLTVSLVLNLHAPLCKDARCETGGSSGRQEGRRTDNCCLLPGFLVSKIIAMLIFGATVSMDHSTYPGGT